MRNWVAGGQARQAHARGPQQTGALLLLLGFLVDAMRRALLRATRPRQIVIHYVRPKWA